MLEFLFGWRKASKCKDMLRGVRRRLMPLMTRRDSVVRQQRAAIAQLLANGSPMANALSRVEQLYQDQSILDAYDLLDHFCGVTIMSLRYIRKHKYILDCPHEIIEAISTLMFTAARLANLPELQVLRKLFSERYGRDFEASSIELYPGNHVNRQMQEKLSVISISNYEMFMLVRDISREFNLPQVLDLYVRSGHRKWDSEILGRDVQGIYTEMCRDQLQILDRENITNVSEKQQMRWDESPHVSSNIRRQGKDPSSSQGSSEVTSDSASVNMIRSCAEGQRQSLRKDREDEDEKWITFEVSGSQSKEKLNKLLRDGRARSSNGYSSKRRKPSEPNINEKSITARIEDAKSSSRQRCSQNSSMASCTKNVEPLYDDVSTYCHSAYQLTPHKMEVYRRAKSTRYERKNLASDVLCDKKNSYESGGSRSCSISSYARKTNHTCRYNMRSSGDENVSPDCCLDHPCYFLTNENDAVSDKISSNIRKEEMVRVCSLQDQSPNLDSEGTPESQRARQYNDASSEPQEIEVERQMPKEKSNDLPQKFPPYQRIMSMPTKRASSTMTSQTLRSASFRHVHPKLPDYDDLAAKFTALKREHSRKSTSLEASPL